MMGKYSHMHPLLANILEAVDKGQTIEATYDSLVDAFKDNYNPLKGENARSEMERWLSKTESVFAMHNKVSFDGFSVRFWKTSEGLIKDTVDFFNKLPNPQVSRDRTWIPIEHAKALKEDYKRKFGNTERDSSLRSE